MSKRKLLLNYDSATALLDVSLIMCLRMFFIFELNNYVTSFVVGAIVAPFNYIGNKTSKNAQDMQLLFFSFCFFVTYIEYLRFINLLFCGDIETNLGPFNRCKSISFYHGNLNDLMAGNHEKFHLVEALVDSSDIDVFCISEVFPDSSVDNIYSSLN